MFILLSRVKRSTQIWPVTIALLASGEHSNTDRLALHRWLAPFRLPMTLLQQNLPVEYLLVRALFPAGKLLTIDGACAIEIVFRVGFCDSINEWVQYWKNKMYCWKHFRRHQYIFSEMHHADRILLQNMVSTILCIIFLGVSIDYIKLFLPKVGTEIPVSPFLTETSYWKDSIPFWWLLFSMGCLRIWTWIFGRIYEQGEQS